MSVKIGVKLPNSGLLPVERGIPELARALEVAGYESLWVSDHIVMPVEIGSRYPFAADGRVTWASDTPYFDALIALALAAAVTERVTLGTAVLVLPLRNPVEFAKQAASIDVASNGRLRLGVGAGWLEEEFQALAVPFERRGVRLEDSIAVARACWTGLTPTLETSTYTLPGGLVSLPTPAESLPVYIGGHTPAALRRAGRVGDGWLGQQSLPELSPDLLVREIAVVRAAAGEAGRDPAALKVVLRIVEAAGRAIEVAARLQELAEAGVDEIIVDPCWDGRDLAEDCEVLNRAATG